MPDGYDPTNPDDPGVSLDLDDDPDDELLDAWQEHEQQVAVVVRDALSDQRRREPPAGIVDAGERLRAALEDGDERVAWMRRASRVGTGLEVLPGVPMAAVDLVLVIAEASVQLIEDPGLDGETQAGLMSLQPADWAALTIALGRQGPGADMDPDRLVAAMDGVAEVEGATDEDDAAVLAHSLELRLPGWQVAGLVDDDRRLTEVGAWVLPRAMCTAMGSDFDHPNDGLGEQLPADAAGDDGPVPAATGDDRAPKVVEALGAAEAWMQRTGRRMDLDWVGTLLDLRLTYLDDRIDRWATTDLGGLIHDVCPLRLSVPGEDIADALGALSCFLEHLEDEGRLADGSDPVDELTAWCRHAVPSAIEAMEDPERWGPAKAMFRTMRAEGVDVDDQQAMQEWIEAFNERPFDERDELLGAVGPAAGLPVQVLPPDEELARLVRQTALFRQVEGLVTYVGERLEVTEAGNLRLADARRLVGELDTGDEVDPELRSGAVATTRSSTELLGLYRTYELAQAAGLLERSRRSVRQVAQERARLANDPVEVWVRLLTAWLRVGLLGLEHDRQRWLSGIWDESILEALSTLAIASDPVRLDPVAESMLELVPDVMLEVLGESRVLDWLHDDGHVFAEKLVVAGLAELDGVRWRTSRHGERVRHRGRLRSTPLTALALHRVAGAPVHRIGQLRDAGAGELLDEIGELTGELAGAEVDAWLAAHAEPARRIGDSLSDPTTERAMMGFFAFDRLGVEAVDVVEGLRDGAVTGPMATAWLVQHGVLDLGEAGGAGEAGGSSLEAMVGILGNALRRGGPDAVIEAVEHVGDTDEQRHLMEMMWRAEAPAVLEVLDAVGSLHPAKIVRKAARKAAFKRRSVT